MTRGHDPRWVSHPDARTPSVPTLDTGGVRGEEAIVANQGYKLLQKETDAHDTMSCAVMPCATWFMHYSTRTCAYYTMLYYTQISNVILVILTKLDKFPLKTNFPPSLGKNSIEVASEGTEVLTVVAGPQPYLLQADIDAL